MLSPQLSIRATVRVKGNQERERGKLICDSHLLQIQRYGHILELSATLQRRRLPPAVLETGAGRDQRLDGSLLGPIRAMRIACATLLGPITMRIRVHQFAVFFGAVLAAGRVHRYRGTWRHIEERRIESSTISGSGADIVRLLAVQQSQSCKEAIKGFVRS